MAAPSSPPPAAPAPASADTAIAGAEGAFLDSRRLLILYGSETGNSQEAAESLGRLAERLHFQVSLDEMDDIDLPRLVQFPLVVFFVSTTGQGEFPRNARKFWKSLLRKRLPPTCLSSLNFTTFGLGDSSYSKFNWAARKLHSASSSWAQPSFTNEARLMSAMTTAAHSRKVLTALPRTSIDGGYLPWSTSLRSHLLTAYPLPEDLSPIPPEVRLPPRFVIKLASDMADASQPLDNKSAKASHIDYKPPRCPIPEERPEFASIARAGEGTVPYPVDQLDRDNVLRDHTEKYSLQETEQSQSFPEPDLLPVPFAALARVLSNARVTPEDHWQDVRRLRLEIQPAGSPDTTFPSKTLLPGTVATIYPKNFPEDVQQLIDLMGWHDVADKKFVHYKYQAAFTSKPSNSFTRYTTSVPMERRAPKGCFAMPDSTLRDLLLNNYDITAIPKRSFFEMIAWHSSDPTHRERLREFSDPYYSDEFYDYTSRPRRSILEILADFPSVKIPFEEVPAVFPVIRGREYSIASGGTETLGPDGTNRADLLVALVKYKTVLRKTRQGLCSRYIESLPVGTEIHVSIIEYSNPVVSEETYHRPLLAIAPGTGVAPVRSLILDRSEFTMKSEAHGQQEVNASGPHFLIYGGRNRQADFFFKEDWQRLGVEVLTAFSRDQRQKIYVQDVIRFQAVRVAKLIEHGACIYICGSAGKMPLAVRQALYDVMMSQGLAVDEEQAKIYIQKYCRLCEDVW